MKKFNVLKGKTLVRSLVSLILLTSCLSFTSVESADEWVKLFNGKDFSGWVVPEGDNGHWRVIDGVIDYDALSQAPGSKDLWTVKEYGDFVLRLDWRLKDTPLSTLTYQL
jgi:hypothetical protein